jgi:hypothetical protein
MLFSTLANIEVGYAPRTSSDLIHRKNLKMVRGAYPTILFWNVENACK